MKKTLLSTIILSVIITLITGCATTTFNSSDIDKCYKQCPHPFTKEINAFGATAVQLTFDNPQVLICANRQKIIINYFLTIKIPVIGTFECSECSFETKPEIINSTLNFNKNLSLEPITCLKLPFGLSVSIIETEIVKIITGNPQEITQCLSSCFPKEVKKVTFIDKSEIIIEKN